MLPTLRFTKSSMDDFLFFRLVPLGGCIWGEPSFEWWKDELLDCNLEFPACGRYAVVYQPNLS